MYTAYVLNEKSRQILASAFPPKYSKWVGHHVTVEFGVPEGTPIPESAKIAVVGYADNGSGLEALIVEVNGSIHRPDGRTYHITWSLNPNVYKPKDSNELIALNGFDKVDPVWIEADGKILR